MTVLILCAGESKRFDWEGVCKHRLPVFDEELLSRTVRQCNDRILLSDEVVIVTHLWGTVVGLTSHCYSVLCPSARGHTCETLMSTVNVWGNDRVTVLLGDTLYSDEVIDRILSTDRDIIFFGSIDKREIYSLSFTNRLRIIDSLNIVGKRVESGHHGQLWQLYYVLNSLPPDSHPSTLRYQMFSQVTDYTRDFDSREDYLEFLSESVQV